MAKTIRRILALVLALTLCAGQVALPAMAAETTVTGSGTLENPQVTVTVEDSGNTSIETVTTQASGTDAGGNTVTQTGTETTKTTSSDSDNGTTYTTQSREERTWEEQEVVTGRTEQEVVSNGSGLVPEGEVGQQVVDTEQTTTVEGSETERGSMEYDKVTGEAGHNGKTTGTETTYIEKNTETTDTFEDQHLYDQEYPDQVFTIEGEAEADKETSYTPGDPNKGTITEGELIKGEDPETTPKPAQEQTAEVDPNGVTLVLKPDGNKVTKTEEFSLEDMQNKLFTLPSEAKPILDKNGNVTGYKPYVKTVTEKDANGNTIGYHTTTITVDVERDSDGNIIKYLVTTKTEDSDLVNSVSGVTTDDADEVQPTTQTITPKEIDFSEYVEDTETGRFTKSSEQTTEDGKKVTVTETVEKLSDGSYRITTTETILEQSKAEDGAPVEMTDENTPATEFVLPPRPEEPEAVTDKDGNTTTVTVKDILGEDGRVTGYETITVVTDKDGKELSAKTETVMGVTVEKVTHTNLTYPADTFTLPERPNESRTEAEDGTVTETIVENIYDDQGILVGYQTVTRVTGSDGKERSRETDSVYGAWEAWDGEAVYAFTLPEKPQESRTTDKNGLVTKVTVEDLYDEQGVHVGYKKITRVTNSEGKERYYESECIYGTWRNWEGETVFYPEYEMNKITTTTTTKTTTRILKATEYIKEVTMTTPITSTFDTAVDITNEYYQWITLDDKMYIVYQGRMYPVKYTSKYRVDEDLATDDTVRLTGYTDADDLRFANEADNWYTGQMVRTDNPEDWTWVGYGLFSDFVLTEDNGTEHKPRQFMIKKGNEVRYVYCTELGTDISRWSSYGENEYSKAGSNNGDLLWDNATGTVAQIRTVALNGFWGTASGLGSLEAVKDLMRRHGLSTDADRLTVGMAVAATQGAIWEFGVSGDRKNASFGDDCVTLDYETGEAPSTADEKTILALRDLLVDLAKGNKPGGTAQEIGKNAITGAALTIRDRVTTTNAKNEEVVKTDSSGSELYDADLSFTLGVTPSSINGDLIVVISDENNNFSVTRRLAGDDSTGKYDKIYPNADGSYTITGLQLAENVKINLTISGTQHLDDGVHIYRNDDWQDFVGLSILEKKVELNVKLDFNVQDPGSLVKGGDTDEYNRTDLRYDTLTQQRTDVGYSTDDKSEIEGTITVSTDSEVYGTIQRTSRLKEVTYSKRDWRAVYNYTETGLLDKDVERAKAPKTGDISALWAAVSLLSLGGMVMLAKKREEA